MRGFLLIIKNIRDYHHRDTNFITRTKKHPLHYKNQIKQTLLNDEIFFFYKDNKLLVHFLLSNGVIRMTDEICEYMMKKQESNGNGYCHFFYRTNYSLSSEIQPSIFETNSFLLERKYKNLIEYSAFFGSIQIFQYLMMNEVELTASLWLYAIHSILPTAEVTTYYDY